MFTRAKIYNGSTYLKNHLRANDYYSKGERVSGEWVGIGAEKLGLRGEVTPEQFESLRSNHHPVSGEQLNPRTKETRVSSTCDAGDVRIRGERLGTIFTLIRSQELGSINCAVDKIAKPEEPLIRDILFEDVETLMS